MGTKTTDLGKRLRKIRIDAEETLGDMAHNLGITSSYLSAIEKGKRPAPANFVKAVASLYELASPEREALSVAADKTLRNVRIPLENISDRQREAALCFARSFDSLDDGEADALINLLHRAKDEA